MLRLPMDDKRRKRRLAGATVQAPGSQGTIPRAIVLHDPPRLCPLSSVIEDYQSSSGKVRPSRASSRPL